jgi:DNA-binding NarL/FixJ family response regulator
MEALAVEGMNSYSPIKGHLFESDVEDGDDTTEVNINSDKEYVLIIDSRALDRECLSRSLAMYDPSLNITTAGSLQEWHSFRMANEPSAVILILGSRTMAEADVCEKVSSLASALKRSPVIVIAESDDLHQVMKAIEFGARGYIPSSVGINVAAEAISLARAGGVFIPASSIMAMKDFINSVANGNRCFTDLFTPREIQISEALRRGKANKIIAYELDLCESTVKVHIRNIMKKLQASNRTEVAFKLRGLMK